MDARAALVAAYRAALRDWRNSPAARQAAATFGMDERRYCDRHVATNWRPVVVTASSAAAPAALDPAACYAEARRLEGETHAATG